MIPSSNHDLTFYCSHNPFNLLICTLRSDFKGGRKVVLQPEKKVGLYFFFLNLQPEKIRV